MKLIDAWNGAQPFEPSSRLLRRVLICNALSSLLSGVLLLAAGPFIAALMGVPEAVLLLQIVGGFFVLFGLGVEWVATRAPINRAQAWTVIALDTVWVAGSVLALPFIASELTLIGEAAVILVALVVLVWAVGQTAGVKRLGRNSASSFLSA